VSVIGTVVDHPHTWPNLAIDQHDDHGDEANR
jgi:hypothetical protein